MTTYEMIESAWFEAYHTANPKAQPKDSYLRWKMSNALRNAKASKAGTIDIDSNPCYTIRKKDKGDNL